MNRILFVDEDEVTLQALERALHVQRRSWEMKFAHTFSDALDLMVSDTVPEVVVANIDPHGSDGLQFLSKTREDFPRTIRFSVSDGVDGQLLLEASNLSHQSIEKPYDSTKLRILIERALALRTRLQECPIKDRLHEIGGLPALPALYKEILDELNSTQPSLMRIASLIQHDISLSAKLLQIVNSAAIGLRHEVTNITQASALMGMEKLSAMVLMVEVFSTVEQNSLPEGLSLEALWEHSLTVADYAKQIARHTCDDSKIIDSSFTAGLLHDIGIIILAANFPDELKAALDLARKKDVSLWEAEKETFSATHAEVGGYLLELWGLPDPVVEAITFHDYPSGVPEDNYPNGVPDHGLTPLTAVHAANYFCEDERREAIGCAQGDVDTVYLERTGYGDQLEYWWTICHEV